MSVDQEPSDLPKLQPGEEAEVDGVLYIHPVPYVEHEHEFVEIEPGTFQCKHCPQGRIGAL